MNYFIVFTQTDFEWCLLTSQDRDYVVRVYADIATPPEYKKELRATSEPIDTYLDYEVLETE